MVMNIRKNILFMYQKKCYDEKDVDILLIGEEGKRQYVRSYITLHFRRYCLQAFRTEDILKYHIKDCFKINGKENIMPKKFNMLNSKFMREKEKPKKSLYQF